MRLSRVPAIVCIGAIILIGLYSAFTIEGGIASNTQPTVVFTLGTADRDVTYCNSQTLDLYIPSVAVTRPLPLAVYVHGGGLTSGDKSDISPIFLNAWLPRVMQSRARIIALLHSTSSRHNLKI